MKKQILIMICALCLAGCGTSGVQAPPAVSAAVEEDEVQERMEQMDLREKIEQMTMISIRSFNGQPFTELNEETESFFETRHPGGFILFSDNLSDTAQIVSLTSSLQKAVVSSQGVPLLIGTDQEGGYITRLPDGTGFSGNMALAATGDVKNSYEAARIIGEELKSLGIQCDFAPDADVNSNPDNPVIGVRSFSDDPETVAMFSSAFAKGLKDAGVIAAPKHFPGHGDTSTDTHTGLAELDLSEEELMQRELIPFQKLITDGCGLLMSAHITFPLIEKETYTSRLDGSQVHLPATLSHALITDLLRGRLGYQGVVMTDAMNMQAVTDHFDPDDAAELAINAGVDLLLMPVPVEDEKGFDAYDAYINAIAEKVKDGEISESRINESVERILRLKQNYGILDLDNQKMDTVSLIQKAEETVGSAEHREKERKIADLGVTVLENKNNLLPFADGGKIVIGSVYASQLTLLQEGFERLLKEGKAAGEPVYTDYDFGRNKEAVLGSLTDASLVVLTTWFTGRSQLEENESLMIPSVKEIIDQAHALGIPIVVITTNLPYDASAYSEADAVLCVYNPAGKAEADATGEIIQSGSPNLPAALDVIFGACGASGKLPSAIPGISGTEWCGTAYERGYGITWAITPAGLDTDKP